MIIVSLNTHFLKVAIKKNFNLPKSTNISHSLFE